MVFDPDCVALSSVVEGTKVEIELAPIVLEINAPVLGLKVIFVLVTFAGKNPVFAVTQTGNIVAFVVVSSVIPIFVAFATVPAVVANVPDVGNVTFVIPV